MRVNEKMKKLLSILLCLCMLLQNAPVMAFAATTDNLCEHHTEHTAECGYREGSAGSACAHEHSEDCYAILECLHTCGEECADGCTHECTVENGCITMELDCHHVHGGCGYSEGTAEVPCGHVHNENCGYVEAVAGNPCANAETDPECDHSGDCGYVAAVEGQPCGHTACDDTCGYAPATEGTPCTHVCEVKVDSDDSCYKLLCSHKGGGHDDVCGYTAAVSGSACTFHCHICHVQELVDALPGEVTAENAEAVAAQLTAIDKEKASLSDEELAQVDFAKYTTAAEGLGSVYAAVPAVDPTCNCETKCAEGSVNSGCAVCGAEGADLSVCTGTETTASGVDDWRVVNTEAGTVTIDGTLGGKTTAIEEDINALLEAIKGYVASGITTIIVTGSEPALIEMDSWTNTAIGEAIYRLSGSDDYDENNPYNGKIDLILQDVTEIVDQEFYSAWALNSITLPQVIKMGDEAFHRTWFLKTITFESVLTEVNETGGVMFAQVGKEVDGCDLILNCGQMDESSVPAPDLTNNIWKFKFENEFKSITLTHTEGTAATCIAQAVCSVCGESYGEVGGHSPDAAGYTVNADGTHSYTCSSCGNPFTESHTFTDGACTGCGVIGGYCGEEGNEQNVIWTYANGTLTISGTGAIADQRDNYDNRPWEEYVDQITTIVVNDGITSIGEAAFLRFQKLTTAKLPDSLTTISQQAFYGCTALKTVNFPANLKTIEGWAFLGCALESVTLPEGLTTIGYRAFNECKNLTSVTVPASVITIDEGAFGYSPAKITVAEDNLNYSSDEHGVLFDKDKTTLIYCRPNIEVETYTIPSTVTEICKEAFYGCKNLATITIPDGVQKIGSSAFGSCEALTTITIPAGVTTIEANTFYHCTALTAVTIPAGVTTIDMWAFSGCTALTTVTIPASVTSIAYNAFSNCSALTTVNVPCTWDGSLYTFDEGVTVKKVHNWVGGACTVCGVPCDHKDSTHITATNNGDGTHSFECSVCNTAVTEDHTIDPATGKCVCDYQFGFYVERDIEIDGIYHETYWFDNLSDALSYAHGSTDYGQYTTQRATVRLHRDLTIEEGEIFSFQKQVVLDTNSFSVTNHGTLALEGYTYSTIPAAITGGTVKIGEKSYTWDSENNKWICAEGSHVTEQEENKATCAKAAICDLCGASYGEVDKTNHASDTYTYTDNSDGTHSAVYPCCGTKGQPENHTPTYTANGSTITESCSENCGYSASLTLKAPANLVYDRTEKAAMVEGEIIADYELTYSADAVIMAGDYTATLTVGDYSVSLAFTIAKADPDVVTPSDLKATYGQTLADVELPGGWAWKNSSASVGSVGSNTFAAIYTPANISNFNTLERDLTVVVAKAMPTVTAPAAADDLVYNGTARTLITAGTATGGTMQYSLDGSNWSETIPTGKDAKTYTVYYKVLGDGNHNDSSVDSVQVTIGKATLTVTADNKTMTTGQELPTFTYTITGFVGGESEDVLTAKPTVVCVADGKTAGTYDITVSGAEADNYEITYVNGTLSVADHQHAWTYTAEGDTIIATCNAEHCPDPEQSITLQVPDSYTYSGEALYSASVMGSIDGVTYTVLYTGTKTNYSSANAPVNADTYTVTLTAGGKSVSGSFTINPKNIANCTAKLSESSFTYDGKAPALTVSVVDSGVGSTPLAKDTDYTVGTVQANAGSHKLTVTGIGNYTGTVKLDYTITAKEVSITGAAIQSVTYDPNGYTLTVTGVTFDGVVDGEDLAYTAEAILGNTNAFGEQDATVTVTLNNSNYNLATATYQTKVTINKAAATVTAAPTPNDLTYTGEGQYLIDAGEVNGGTMHYSTDNQTWSTTIPQGTDAGKYTVYYKVVGDANHSDTAVDSIEVTIAKADPVIGTVGCEMALFDSIAASAVELKRTDMTVDGTLILTDSELTAGEGTYNWKFTPEDADNYNTITGTVVLTVTADVLEQIRATGTLEKFSYVYGEPFSIDGMTITASYTSGTTKDVTGLVSFDSTLAVGQTAVELTYQGKICVIDGITVARKQLDVSGMAWDVPENAVYSGTAYTATLTGELPEGVTVTKTGNTATNAGNYTAKAVFSLAEGFSADNYEIVNGADLTAEWSIDKADLTITADSYESVRYGSAAPAFAANYSGFVNGETEAVLGGELVFSCEYDTANAAKRKPGDYPIVPGGLTSNNYEISYVDGNLEVISANLVIVIDDKTVTYGDAAPEYTYHYEGFVYGEDISVMDEPGTVSCTYVPGNAVGTMEIKSDNYGSDDCYLVVNQRIGTLTVEKALLTITAEDNSITYGDAPAANGVTGTGFVNGESFDDLSGELTYSYNYEQFGNVGTYKITPVGLTSGNYEITFADGTLTVNAKAITVTADAVSKTYGDADPKLTYTAQGLVNGDELTGELKRAAGENVGSYAIEQNTLTAGNNYSITYTGANLTINAKAITEADVELNGSLTYTGKEQTQPITVTEGITYEVTGNKATNVGSYVLTVKGTGNYTGEVKLNWSIKEAAAVVGKAPTAKELTYTGTAQALVNAGTTADGKLVYSLSENGEFTDSIPTGQDAGEYTVWYYVQGDDNHSDSAKASVKVTIAKADPVIGTVGCDMALFDSTAASAVELTRTDMSVEGTLVLTDSELTAGEGTYNWKFTPEDTDNYNTITGTVVLNVTADVLEKIEASGTLEKDSYSYGDTFSIDGLTVTAIYTTGATKDVTDLVSFDNTLAVGQTSVELTYQGKTCTVTGFSVAKKRLVIDRMAWDIPENAVYSGTAYNATLTGNLPEGVTVTKTGDTATNAGDYTAKAVFSLAEGYSADNYEIVNGEDLTADWTIAKKNIAGATITLGTALTYNGKQQTQTVASVKIDGLTVTYTVSGNTGTDAKGYTLTVTGNGNFEGTETKEWSIAKKNISGATITLGDSLTYNGNERTQEVTDVKIGELTVTYDVTANKQTNAGSYTLTVTGNGNFEGSATADWSIAKAKLTITANNNSITYGDIPAANGVTGTGFVSSESIEDLSGELTYSYNYEQFGNVGTYKITPSGVTSNNYEITFADGTLTVNAKAITVTADAVSKTYGDADPKLTYKVEGLVNGDELTGELKRVAGENVGDYAIEQNTLTAGNNYRLAYTGAKLTIKAKAITAADVKLNGSLTYNGKEQTQAITVTEGITYEVTGNKATNVGTYELTVKGTGNYTGSVTLDWTITKAKLTITADSKVIYIGEKLPTLTYTVSGLVGGDKLTKEPALTTNADADQAGSYTITAANADAGMNYAITYVGGTLTIMDKNTEVETKVETAALTEVPDGLKNTKFNTVEAIKQELTSRIVATSTGFVKENMAHYDVTLQFSLDGGETWILATEENFPTEGIIVTLPYPYGTNAAGYDFVVSHMFTVTSQRLGTTAGDVELPSVTETASGIRVTLKGLSPVTLAWRATEFDVKIAGTTNGTVSTNVSKATSGTEITVTVTPKYGYKMATLTVKDASGKSYAVSTDNSGKYYFTMPSADVTVTATFSKISSSTADTTNPKTGDDFQLMLWSSILSTSAIFLLAALADQKRKLIK